MRTGAVLPASKALPPDLVARLRASLERLNPGGGRIGLAVSGGPDSMAMLLLAHQAIPGQFEVATINHGLRAEAADECALVAVECAERGGACAVLAVTEQESSFRADPAVPNLGKIAREEIDRRAERLGVPGLAVGLALRLRSPDGTTYAERIDAAKTEKQLSEIFEDFIGMVPLGKRLFAGYNPVRTGGPMQVSIAFAEAHAQHIALGAQGQTGVRRQQGRREHDQGGKNQQAATNAASLPRKVLNHSRHARCPHH